MDLIISCKDLRIYNISSDLIIKEKYVNNINPKAVAINNFDGQTLGILHKNDVLRTYSMLGESKTVMSLKSNTNCFSFFKSDTIVAGDTSGNIYVYDVKNGNCRSSLISKQAKNDSIESINVSPGHILIYCLHKSGMISRFNIKKEEGRILELNKIVSVFDVSRWSYEVTLLGCDNGVVVNYDSEKEKCINLWEHHKSNVTGVAISIHNKLLAVSVSEERTAALLACDMSRVVKSFALRNVPTSCTFMEDNYFAIGDETGLVSIFDIRMTKLIQQLQTEGKVTFVGFNHTDGQLDRSDISFKSRVFRETQNITDSLSGNSLFSVDDSIEIKEINNRSLDLSHFSLSMVSMPNVSQDIKRHKQVKFKDNIATIEQSPPKLVSTKAPVQQRDKIPISTIMASTENISQDNAAIRKIISEELKKELTSFEFRIKNDLIFGMIDQLSITEKNILSPLQSLIKDNNLLAEENEMLRQELQKYKYNV